MAMIITTETTNIKKFIIKTRVITVPINGTKEQVGDSMVETSLQSLIQTHILKVHTMTMITWDGAIKTTGTE